jgi:hypothetical protein
MISAFAKHDDIIVNDRVSRMACKFAGPIYHDLKDDLQDTQSTRRLSAESVTRRMILTCRLRRASRQYEKVTTTRSSHVRI